MHCSADHAELVLPSIGLTAWLWLWPRNPLLASGQVSLAALVYGRSRQRPARIPLSLPAVAGARQCSARQALCAGAIGVRWILVAILGTLRQLPGLGPQRWKVPGLSGIAWTARRQVPR